MSINTYLKVNTEQKKSDKKNNSDKLFVVARGGRSAGKSASHIYGEVVLNILKKNNLKVKDLYLHPNGMYTLDGEMTDIHTEIPTFHYIWIALVGIDGQSGAVQELCERYGVRHSGERLFHSTLSHHVYNTQKIANQHGVKTPYSYITNSKNVRQEAQKSFSLIGIPLEIKSSQSKSIEHFYTAHSFSELESHLEKVFKDDHQAIVSKKQKGDTINVFIHKDESGINTSIFGDINKKHIKENLIKIRNEALYVYHAIGFADFIECDFDINDKGIFFKSINTHPDILSEKYMNLWHGDFDFEDFVMQRVPHLD